MIRPILLLGNPVLYEESAAVRPEDMDTLSSLVEDLHDTLMDYRARYGAGRAIAAPQIGDKRRVLYMHISEPVVFINPELIFDPSGTIEVLDDCMSFPGLYVRVKRYRRCVIRYTDMNGQNRQMALERDLAELLQHEYDHLDGILATMRAIDSKAFVMKA